MDAPATPPAPPIAPVRRPSSPPGAKKARHKKWVRIATIATVVAVVGSVAWAVVGIRPPPTREESELTGCRDFLGAIAAEIDVFSGRRNRLPKTLAELRDTETQPLFDAEPWDCWKKPIEYRVVDESTREFRLRSYGPDVKPDSVDDLVWPSGKPWR